MSSARHEPHDLGKQEPALPDAEEAARRAARLRTAADFNLAPAPLSDASLGRRRMVRLLKVALPLLALALIAAMLIYSITYKPDTSIAISYSDIGTEQGEIVMVAPRFVGTDKNNEPFEVYAKRALQDPADRTMVELETLDANLSLANGPKLRLTAKKGILDTSNQLLTLIGPIELSTSQGNVVRTAGARADLKNGLLSGQQAIEATGAFGTIRADGFDASRAGRSVNFVGHVSIHLVPAAEENK